MSLLHARLADVTVTNAHPAACAPGPLPQRTFATPSFSVPELAMVVAAHAAVLALLLAFEVLPIPAPMATLMVRMVQPETAPAPAITPPKPKPVSKPQPRPQALAERPTFAATTPTPEPSVAAQVSEKQPPPAPAVTAAPLSEPRYDAAYLDNPAPHYPPLSRRIGEQGKVILRVFVDAGGRPSQIEVRNGSGYARLDQAATDAVWRWKFVPAKRGSEAVAAWVLVPIAFNLRD